MKLIGCWRSCSQSKSCRTIWRETSRKSRNSSTKPGNKPTQWVEQWFHVIQSHSLGLKNITHAHKLIHHITLLFIVIPCMIQVDFCSKDLRLYQMHVVNIINSFQIQKLYLLQLQKRHFLKVSNHWGGHQQFFFYYAKLLLWKLSSLVLFVFLSRSKSQCHQVATVSVVTALTSGKEGTTPSSFMLKPQHLTTCSSTWDQPNM